MSSPVAPGGPSLSSRLREGANALSAPTTPERRLPVVDKSQVDPQLRQAAEGMEAMFLDFMMKVMRDTVPKSEMSLDSPATQIYTSMMDSETAQKAARAGGVGLADQIIAYWEADKYNLKKGQQGRPGGFHEDRANTQQSGARRPSGGNE